MKIGEPNRLRLGAFEVNLKTGELRSLGADSDGRKVLLHEQPFRVLRILIDYGGEMATREEIKRRLWPNDTIVDFDNSINVAVATLRRAFGDSAVEPRYIETIPRRGYRLMVPVERVEPREDLRKDEPGDHQTEDGSQLQVLKTGLIGKKISHFRVLDVIGEGGMGVVFKAEDLKLDRFVALKFLPEEFADDPIALNRFEREARMASSLSHRNICTIYAVEEFERLPVIVMELLKGETLRDRLARAAEEPISLDEQLDIALQTCDGLAAAHSSGIVHRDIKPANLFIATDKTAARCVKILDFGLAKLIATDPLVESEEVAEKEKATTKLHYSASSQTVLAHDSTLSRTGMQMGTASYMAPEQIRKEKLDPRIDLFSFGLVLYEMATGHRAFEGDSVEDVHQAILHQPLAPARARNPVLPRSLDLVLAKALEKDPNRRYQSATAMKGDLAQIAREVHPARRWTRRALAAGVLLALGALSFWRYEVYHHRITLSPTDTIVLADTDNRTNDPIFGSALNTALRYEMEQTPYLNVLELDKVYATLGQLKLAPTTNISVEIARQICGKTNSKMVISDSIADAGNRYHLEMRALDCGSGATLAEESTDISARNQVVHELGATAARLRRKLGEPVESLARFNQPLDKASTASLEALQTGAAATKLFLAGNPQAALPLYERGIELDPDFALVYEGIGAANQTLGHYDLMAASYTRAHQLRDRMTEKDRLNAEYLYYSSVTGELDKAYSVLLRCLELFPRNVYFHTNLADTLAKLGQFRRAADLEDETARLEPSPLYFSWAAEANIDASRFNEARSWLAQAEALKFDSLELNIQRLRLAFIDGDLGTLDRIFDGEAHGPNRVAFLREQSKFEAWRGRFDSADRLRLQTTKLSSDSEDISLTLLLSALQNAEAGRAIQARKAQDRALQSKLDRDQRMILALSLARSGRIKEASRLADEVSREAPLDTIVQRYLVPTVRAALKLQQHDPQAAIDLLRETIQYDFANNIQSFNYLYPAYIRGLAYLELGDGRSAAVEFQKLVDNPGICWQFITGPLARLQLGRAQRLIGDNASARKSYEGFLNIWKDADPDIPIYRQAKAEYAALRTSTAQ